MEGLYYTPKEKFLFFIPNYYTHGTGMLDNLIKNLNDAKEILRKFVPDEKVEIYCDEIQVSRRYKSMWYFRVICEKAPKEAFVLNGTWTMHEWLKG